MNLLSNRIGHRFRSMVRQDLAQIVVDSLDQILVRNGARAQRERGAKKTAIPVIVSAVPERVTLSEIVALQPHGPGDIQSKVIIIDGDPLPHATEHSGEIIAEQQ